MVRTLSVCALLIPFSMASAQQPAANPNETVIRMKLQAAAAPTPALKYMLLPELRELSPGNPILGYLKCFSEQNAFFHGKDATAQREKYLETPFRELPVLELRGYGGIALRRADDAARLSSPDWEVLLRLRTEGLAMLVPEVQQMRVLAGALLVRFRGDVADSRFDDAVTSAKTLLALSRHMAEHPTLIGDLVGIAIASMAMPTLEDMIQQPGCPNLFWALTDLPSPFIDLRKGMQGERLLLTSELGVIDDAAAMSEAQLDQAVKHIERIMSLGLAAKAKRIDVRDWLDKKVKDEVGLRFARKRLVEHGLAGDKLRSFPPLQLVLLDEKRAYEVRRDEAMKLMLLPYCQAEPFFPDAKPRPLDEELLGWLAPSLLKVRIAQARLDQRLGMVRCAEAIRLYAATNGGRLPAKLDDLKVPLPVDPITGRAFVYSCDGAVATLRGTPPRGMEHVAPYNVRYEIVIAK